MPGVNPYPTITGSASHEIHTNKHGQAVSMFRASPWVIYEPTRAPMADPYDMDQDVDMDAPLISTLREEDSPPPQPKAFRRSKASHKPTHAWPRPRRKEIHTDEEYDEVEEVEEEPEEDQLIDDDDELMKPVPAVALPNPSRSADASKRKTSAKRKQRKTEKRIAEDERKAQEKSLSIQAGPHSLPPTMSWFEATPQDNVEDGGQISAPPSGETSRVGTPKKSPKKVAAPPKKRLPSKYASLSCLLFPTFMP